MKITTKTLKRIAHKIFIAYSKKELLLFLKDKLQKDRRWSGRALERIYQGQTKAEQIEKSTHILNNQGFTGRDAKFLSSLYESYISHNNNLTEKQWAALQKIIPRYAGQLMRSNYFRLETLIKAYEKSFEKQD